MTQTKNEKQIDWCLRKAVDQGRKHKGLRKVEPNKEMAQKHLEKAKRNLQLVEHLVSLGYADWAVSSIFYALYHSLLAITWHYGYESRNQTCTFAVVEQLILDKKIEITIADLQEIRENSDVQDDTFVGMREYYQYGTDTEVEADKLAALRQKANEFVTKVRIMLSGAD